MENRNITSHNSITYLSSDSSSAAASFDPEYEYEEFLNTLYSSALLQNSQAQNAPMDPWGNVKIPTIESLAKSEQQDPDGWLHVDQQKGTSYSSLIGIPISGTRTGENNTFLMQSHYMVLHCPKIYTLHHLGETNVPVGGFIVDIEGIEGINQSMPCANATSYPTRMLQNVGFASGESYNGAQDFIANCTMNRTSVESNILCSGKSCEVTRIRPSRYDRRPATYTPLAASSVATQFASDWSNSARTPNVSSSTEFFIQDPILKDITARHNTGYANLTAMATQPDLFAQRLSLLFNTYWQAGLVPVWQFDSMPDNLTEFNQAQWKVENWFEYADTFVNTTESVLTWSSDVYVCDRYWATILIFISLVLVCCTISGAFLEERTLSPIVFGYVSSMTRDNPYFNLPPGGCTLEGSKRSRLLKDLKVRIQDVAADNEEAGHIAFSAAERPNARTIVKDRLYEG